MPAAAFTGTRSYEHYLAHVTNITVLLALGKVKTHCEYEMQMLK